MRYVDLVVKQIPALRAQAKFLHKGNQQDTEDLVQETLLKLLRANNEGNYTENSKFKQFASTIMQNTYINLYRRRKRNLEMPQTENEDMYDIPLSEEPIYNSIDCENINKVIVSLSERRKRSILFYMQGYQYDEIAKIENVPIGTIKSRIFFARKDIATKLEELYSIKLEEA